MVMGRLANRQYGGSAYGSDYYGGGGPSVEASISGSATASSGDARWTGVIVIVLLAVALVGYHGLKVG